MGRTRERPASERRDDALGSTMQHRTGRVAGARRNSKDAGVDADSEDEGGREGEASEARPGVGGEGESSRARDERKQ